MRKEYELTQEQYDKLLADIHSDVPLIALQCGGQNPSKQERANMAWERLGIQMGQEIGRPVDGQVRTVSQSCRQTGRITLHKK